MTEVPDTGENHGEASVIGSRDYVFNPTGQIAPYPCESVTEIIRPKGQIPHYLPGTNPYLQEYQANHGIPSEAAMGGAETMYPEYKQKIAKMPKPPAKELTKQETEK